MDEDLKRIMDDLEHTQEETQKLEETLGRQAMELLHQAGFYSLKIDPDGSISGEYSGGTWLPMSSSIDNIELKIRDGKIIIDGTVKSTSVDDGRMF